MSKVVTAKGKEFTFDDNVTDEQIGEALDEYFAGNTEDVGFEPLKKKEPTTQNSTTPLSPSALGLREPGSEVETSFASKGAEMQPVTPKVEGDRVRPTSQSMIEKIEGMTRKVKYPEYVGEKKQEPFDFKKASADVRLEEEKKKQQEISIRAEERRRNNTSLRINDLKEQRKSLVASYNKDDVKKLIEINALIDNLQEQQKAQEQTYYSFGKLNKSATKGVENELLSYLAKNPKIADEVQKRDLTEKETYSLVRNAVAEKTMPLAQDMKMFMEDGTYNLANEKYKVSKTLQEKQDKLEQSGEKLKNLQSEYLNKSGYSNLNSQYDAARKKVDALKPVEANINSQYKLYSSQIADIDKAMGAYSSKIKGETFYGTQDELNQYNNLVKDRKLISDKIESLINSDDAKAYDNAIKQLNSISSQINSITSNLKSGEIGKLKMDYELQLKDYNAALEQYKKFDEPKVKERLGQYYETVDKINSYDKKLAKVKGQFASISEIEEAQKKFDGTGVGGDVLSIAGRAANSILDASKKLVSSPFRIASSLSDAYGPGGSAKYHLSEYIADLIEGTGKEEMFMTKYSKPFYDAETDEINWGAVPFFNSIADNVGILTLFALTGRYGAAPYASAMTAEGATALEGQQVLKAAQTATTIAPAFMVSYGENYKDALKKGFDNSQAVIYSSTMSLLEGLSELIMPDQEILFGKGAKDVMLSRFIKDYAKGKKYAAYKLAEQFIENGIGEANEENVILLGNTISTAIGSLFNENVQAELPTLNNVITTDATAGALGSLMSLPSGLSEQSELYKTGIYKFAQDFETGNKFLTRLKEKGVIDEKKYNRLVTDVQKYQAVMGTVPDGLSVPKKIGIIEKLIEAKTLRSQMNDEKDNPINAINKKKIKILTEEIENIIDDKEYDKKFEESINTEAENAKQKMTTAPQVVLQKYATSTDEKYGYIDRGDGKSKVELTKEQFINEQRQYANQETKQQSGVDIQQPMGEGEGNIGTDGEISKQKQYEEEPVKEKDGEPMPGGVQGLRAEGEGGKESAELRPEEEALDTKNAKDIGDIQINDINSGNVVIGYHATPTGEIGTGKELGIHIGTEDVSNNIKKGRNADKGDVKKVAFRVNKPLILGDMPSWSSINVLNEMMRLKLLGIDKEKIREIRDSDLSEKEKQQRVIELAKEKGYDSFAYQNFDEGNGEFSYVLFDDSKLNDITPKEAKATPQAGSVVGGESAELRPEEEIELPKDQLERPVGSKEYKEGKTHKVGRTITRTAPDGTKVKGTFKLVPAKELIPSHNPDTFSKNENFPQTKDGKTINDRDYETDAPAQAQVIGIAQNFDGTAVTQMPTVSKEGIVYDGNNRTMSRQMAAKNKTDGEYMQALKEQAEMHGFTEEQVNEVENPMLVFEVEKNLPFDTETMARFNKTEKKAQSPVQRAVAISKRISDRAKRQLAALYEQAETPSDVTSNQKMMKDAMDILVSEGLVQTLEIPRFVEKGVATPDGVSLLEGIVMAASLKEDAIRELSVQGMGDIKSVIIKNIVGLMQNSTKGEDSLIPDITQAINITQKAKALKISVQNYLSQYNAFEENEYTLGEMCMALLLDTKKPTELKKFLANYNQDVGVENLLGEDTSKQGILDRTLTNILKNYEQVKKNLEGVAEKRKGANGAGAEKPKPAAEPSPKEEVKPTISDDLNNFLKGDKGGLMQPDTDAMVKQFVEMKRKQGVDDNELRKGLEDAADKGIIPKEKIDEYMGVEKNITFVPQEPKKYDDTGKQKQRSEQAGDRGGREESRKLAPLKDSPSITGATGPDPNIVSVAEEYARSKGITLKRQAEYVPINEAFATRIANAYESMAHNPQDPKVKEAYQELIKQTKEQYDALVKAGYEFTFYDNSTDPYNGNPYSAMRDLRQNKRMAVYGTYAGYGTEGKVEINIEDNPMMVDVGLKWKDQNGIERNVTANDLFRAVHDAFGHSIEGAGFRARGEENAWQAHARLYTGKALAALTTETRGQNNWLNYGPYGEANRNAKVEDTIFAPQKIGLMPEWTWKEGVAPDMTEATPERESARQVIKDVIDNYYQTKEGKLTSSEKQKARMNMSDMMAKNPSIKYIFDKLTNIHKQLEMMPTGEFKKTKNCP